MDNELSGITDGVNDNSNGLDGITDPADAIILGKATYDPRLELFIDLMGRGVDQAKAAHDAGYGGNFNSAKVISYKLIKKDGVAKRIADKLGKTVEELLPKVREVKESKNEVRRRKAALAFIEGQDLIGISKAAGLATKNANSAMAAASRLLNEKETFKLIKEVLDLRGLDEDFMAQKLLEGMLATRPVIVKDGLVDYPDYAVRANYIQMVLKLRGHFKPETAETNGPIIVRIENSLKSAKVIDVNGGLNGQNEFGKAVEAGSCSEAIDSSPGV